ncbi:DEAD/DEAH box helicase [Corynebacterium lubricantis]|uniref:DEAD/DEAH box helicase n=1 Tax=Corynebacterium lubricantis TaxID=541095 RepID=UPI0003801737|nr:DEAD/DEAH box helicase [Corynebacterium lubricantis]
MSSLLPVSTADHLRRGVTEYLTTSFSLADKETASRLRDFLNGVEQDADAEVPEVTNTGMFHGPYVRTRLPYAPDRSGKRNFEWTEDRFVPYLHQARAFERLASTADGVARRPDPTLVITGTGSGKTEAFLYPILEHCRRNPGRGMKALILYPMNALAADQARRLSDTISKTAELTGVTAGIYTGEQSGSGARVVSSKGLITDRDVMRNDVPDIVLTNYKMLDQLLLREADKQMWVDSATTLQYLVLDEFHTYDGAQGTDVALLLRRLGLRLKENQPAGFLSAEAEARPLGQVTPVATSATLGGKDNIASMLEFAYTIFGEQLGADAVITETKLDYQQWVEAVKDMVGPSSAKPGFDVMPDANLVQEVNRRVANALDEGADQQEAVHAAMCELVWGTELPRDAAVSAYASHPLTRAILEHAATPTPLTPDSAELDENGKPVSLVGNIFDPEIQRLPDNAAAEFLTHVLTEMAFLRADYVREHSWEGKTLPGVETHLWVREVSRVDRHVTTDATKAMFRWADDGPRMDESSSSWLPACYCRNCGRSGWMIARQPGDTGLETDPAVIRKGSLNAKERQLPLLDASGEAPINGSMPRDAGADSALMWLNIDMPTLSAERPDDATMETGSVVPVRTYAGADIEGQAKNEVCPSCGVRDSIRYLGSSVATLLSVALSNLFGLADLDDSEKKTLVFTDSVQDAAHRAGFIQSRARAFALRTRIRHAIETSTQAAGFSEPQTLTQIVSRIMEIAPDDYRSRYELLPPHMVHWAAYEDYWLPSASSAEQRRASQTVRERLNLDVALEFGQRSDLPRSLSSTGTLTSSVDVPDSLLLSAAEAATDKVPMPMGETNLLGWARGVIEMMRTEGGINHSWFNSYLRSDGNTYMLARPEMQRKGMPRFQRGSAPSFPRAGSSRLRSDSGMMPLSSDRGLYARWTKRSLGLANTIDASQAVTNLAAELAQRDVLGTSTTDSGATAYHLSPDSIIVEVEEDPALLECPSCHVRLSLGKSARESMVGQPCRTLDCHGHYEVAPIADNYYRQLYSSSTPRTVISKEHTGLLPKETRQTLERQFKATAATDPDAPNVLVATPTLEMGIDIGDLSTVMLSSMPKTVASYVQRVGRAGRLTGNSLIVALVRGRGSALPALERPLSMIAGSVDAPAAFLSATEIVRREFTAYLLDGINLGTYMHPPRVAADVFGTAPGKVTVVDVLKEILSQGVDDQLASFSTTLAGHVEQDTIDELSRWAKDQGSDSLLGNLVKSQQEWNAERRQLLAQKDELEKHWSTLSAQVESPAADDEVRAQERQARAGLAAVRKSLNALTDGLTWIAALERYGLLPNFTLLDDSVQLQLSVRHLNDNLEFDTDVFDYERGVSSALTELAPGATFYAQGVAATIDAVDLGPENSGVQSWRICPSCSHSEIVDDPAVEGQSRSCPECGEPAWRDVAQLIDVLPLRKVYADVDQTRSAITDFVDDRVSPRFHQHVSIVRRSEPGARWYLNNTGFGIEHLPRVDVRWINLGRGPGEKRLFSSKETDTPLFTVCSHCGHVANPKSPEEPENTWRDHRAWCPLRNANEPESRSIALGRTLTTEAVLMRLPVRLTVADNHTIPSVIAALKLGFKEALGGNPDHLSISTIRVGSGEDSYDGLLIYDEVPGGTGYLTQFKEIKDVHRLLNTALNRLKNCSCADDDRECCSNCLLPYASMGAQATSLSREVAVETLAKILLDNDRESGTEAALAATWDSSQISETVQAQDEGSALEIYFLKTLQQALTDRGASMKRIKHGGGRAWEISLGTKSTKWRMTERVQLGPTEPDFYFENDDPNIKNVAVYTDGITFHATNAHNRVADDLAKRNWIYQENMVPWTLTWKDLDDFRAAAKGNRPPAPVWIQPALNGGIAQQLNISSGDLALLGQDPMTQLLELLVSSDQQRRERVATAALLHSALDVKTGQLKKTYYDLLTVEQHTEGTKQSSALTLEMPEGSAFDLEHDKFIDAWRIFWHLANLFYLSTVQPLLTVASADRPVSTVEIGAGAIVDKQTDVDTYHPDLAMEGWTEAREEFEDDEEAVEALARLAAAGVRAPDDIGEEIASVPTVVSWAAEKIALVFPGDGGTQGDWTFIDADSVTADELPDELAQLRNTASE